jgi:hypothetical protein
MKEGLNRALIRGDCNFFGRFRWHAAHENGGYWGSFFLRGL